MANRQNLYPFLRWAGGKTRLIERLDKYIPQNFNNYHELFLGGSSLFVHLVNNERIKKKAFLSDINNDLINTYIQIRDSVEDVISFLATYKNNKTLYYRIRSKNVTDLKERAARFIFLNRTSFNGIYRENLKGVYNVPYGFKKYKELFDFNNLRAFSTKLQGVVLQSIDFEEYLTQIEKNDFIFLDPPYTVAHSNNGFIKYNQKLFSIKDQKRLAEFIKKIEIRGAYFILTNAYHKNIRKIFNDFDYEIVKRYSVIGGKNAERKRVNEFIFYNTSIKKL
jgi:DNA adenine methylase